MAEITHFYDVNLLGVTAGQLEGPWRLECLRTGSAGELAWAGATHLELHTDGFALHSSGHPELYGGWQLRRHARLGQPYLVFDLPGAPTQALVTRLRHSPDGTVRQMVLYFQSGTELLLTHP